MPVMPDQSSPEKPPTPSAIGQPFGVMRYFWPVACRP
jgi:hypothetical protein